MKALIKILIGAIIGAILLGGVGLIISIAGSSTGTSGSELFLYFIGPFFMALGAIIGGVIGGRNQ